jgi:hypothetical protein
MVQRLAILVQHVPVPLGAALRQLDAGVVFPT